MEVKESAATYPSKKKTYSYEDYLKLPDDRNRYEIIDGELIMTPSPIEVHQRVSFFIESPLILFVEGHNLGAVYHAPFDVVLSEKNVVQPDILFIAKEDMRIVTENNIQGAPDLIIEILSPTTAYYDLFDKKDLYEKFGVKEYWIVDPRKRWIEIYIIEDDKYKLYQRAEKSGKVSSLILKGFNLALWDIFKEWR